MSSFVPAAEGFSFAPVTEADLPLLQRWLTSPHVAEWWAPAETPEALRQEFLPLVPDLGDARYIAWLDECAIGYIQSYMAVDTGSGWWKEFADPTVRGIDQFIGDPDLINRGLGTAMVRAFCAFLFADPSVTAIQLDPDPTNARAIRCYEKAGFTPVGLVETPDGTAYLMRLPRPAA